MIQLFKEVSVLFNYRKLGEVLYYVLLCGCYNASFLQLKTFILNTVPRKVSAVGNIQSVEVSDSSVAEFSKTEIQLSAHKSDKK